MNPSVESVTKVTVRVDGADVTVDAGATTAPACPAQRPRGSSRYRTSTGRSAFGPSWASSAARKSGVKAFNVMS